MPVRGNNRKTQEREAKMLLALEQNDDIWMPTSQAAVEAENMNQRVALDTLNSLLLVGKANSYKDKGVRFWKRRYND